MIMNTFLKLAGYEDYESFVNFISSLNPSPFAEWFGGQDRITLDIDEINDVTQSDPEVKEYLNEGGFDIVDYPAGIVFDRNKNRNIRIGKALESIKKQKELLADQAEKISIGKKHNDLLKILSNSKYRNVGSKEPLKIIMSINPHDVAKASYGRRWTSCLNLDDGINDFEIYCSIMNGSIVAYLVYESDDSIENPLSRILIKRYSNKSGDSIAVMEPVIYGIQNAKFEETVKAWLNDKQPDYQQKIQNNNYSLGAGQLRYSDGARSLFKETDDINVLNDIVNFRNDTEQYNGIFSVKLFNKFINDIRNKLLEKDLDYIADGLDNITFRKFDHLNLQMDGKANSKVFKNNLKSLLIKQLNVKDEDISEFTKIFNQTYIYYNDMVNNENISSYDSTIRDYIIQKYRNPDLDIFRRAIHNMYNGSNAFKSKIHIFVKELLNDDMHDVHPRLIPDKEHIDIIVEECYNFMIPNNQNFFDLNRIIKGKDKNAVGLFLNKFLEVNDSFYLLKSVLLNSLGNYNKMLKEFDFIYLSNLQNKKSIYIYMLNSLNEDQASELMKMISDISERNIRQNNYIPESEKDSEMLNSRLKFSGFIFSKLNSNAGMNAKYEYDKNIAEYVINNNININKFISDKNSIELIPFIITMFFVRFKDNNQDKAIELYNNLTSIVSYEFNEKNISDIYSFINLSNRLNNLKSQLSTESAVKLDELLKDSIGKTFSEYIDEIMRQVKQFINKNNTKKAMIKIANILDSKNLISLATELDDIIQEYN